MEERRLCFIPGAAAQARVDELLASEGLRKGEFVHIHPASRWSFKSWTADRNAELIDRLANTARVVLTAAPEPAEASLIEAIVSRS